MKKLFLMTLVACLLLGGNVMADTSGEPIKIGAVFAVTGRASWLGEPERNTVKMIEAEINASELKEPLQRFEDEFKSTVDSVKTGVDKLNDPLKDLDPLVSDSDEKPDEPNDAA